jgi:transposase-like protein
MTKEEKDEEKRAARRAYKNEWQRKKHAERRKANVCMICGGQRDAAASGDAYKDMCLTCTEAVRRREILRREEAQTPNILIRAPRGGWRRKVSVRVCRHCQGRDLVASGPPYAKVGKTGEQRQRFLCLGCKKWSYGAVLPQAPELLCPYCKGRCIKAGVLPSGSQQYLCRGCGRKNTNLFPGVRKDTSGPFRRVVCFYFGPLGGKALTTYCNRHGMQAARALRTILREAAVPLVAVSATAQREWPVGSRWQWSHVRVQKPEPSREPLRNTPLQLPDVRSSVSQARMQSPSGRLYRTVAVECKVSVGLDDLAWEGLIRHMRWRGVTHQEAMRQLLMEAWHRL